MTPWQRGCTQCGERSDKRVIISCKKHFGTVNHWIWNLQQWDQTCTQTQRGGRPSNEQLIGKMFLKDPCWCSKKSFDRVKVELMSLTDLWENTSILSSVSRCLHFFTVTHGIDLQIIVKLVPLRQRVIIMQSGELRHDVIYEEISQRNLK